jgi:Flp pilus assembly protein TadD
MSLLLEALKKAELAKQGALAANAQPEELDSGSIRFEEPDEPTLRPDQMPKFDTSEIERAPAPVATPAPVAEQVPIAAAPSRPPAPPPSDADVVSPPRPNPQRDAARQMFEAKEVDYNPKRPFYITLGVLGLAAVGYGVYLWWQLQPHYSVNTAAIQNAPKSAPISKPVAPPPPVTDPQTEQAATPAAEDKVQTATATPSAGAQPALSAPAGPAAVVANAPSATAASKPAPTSSEALPRASSAQRPARAGVAAPAAATPAATAGTLPAAPQAAAAPRPARLPIKITPPAMQGNAVLENAYAAFQSGDFDKARSEYEQVLGREATNRDALLGLAAIDVRTRDYETAEMRYLKLIELDPRDTLAQAALIALQGNVDPVQLESRIKNLIAAQPDATHLYFALGNQYSAQSRWGEAQDAYFRAFSADPENADFAFNLAVSLDHLRQRRVAADYYRKAVALAGTRPVGFDRRQAETRAQELER